MAITDVPMAATEEALLAPHAPGRDVTDINGHLQDFLQRHFADVIVTGWDSVNVDVFHKSAPETKIGGFLLVTARTLEAAGEAERRIEIDDQHRPLPEEVIAVLGRPAVEKEKALRDKAVFIRGEPRGSKLARVICSDICPRSYVY